MTDLQPQDDEAVILEAADEPIVSDPVTPQAGEVPAQRLSKLSGVFRPGNSLPQIAEDLLLCLGCQLAQFSAGTVIEFNRPNLRGTQCWSAPCSSSSSVQRFAGCSMR